MNTEYVIVGKDIKKKYKKFALEIDQLQVPKGFATALIGENGAGKSTLMNLLSGSRLDYFGEVRYFDEQDTIQNPDVQERIGYTAPNGFFLPHWTVNQVAEICAMLHESFSLEAFEDFCKRLDIPNQKKAVKTLSDGNRMKLTLATAFCRETSLLMMDEPASPLDPLMRDMLCQLIREYLAEGNGERSVFFSTHNIADMENVTDYAIILHDGHILEQGFVEDLKEKYVIAKGDPENQDAAAAYLIGKTVSKFGFEGLCKSEDMDKLAGMQISFESPNLSQICVGLMREHTKLQNV